MKKIITGILAHVDAGKTTLSEAMLYNSNTIRKLGRVDHKSSFLDTAVQERARGITIYSKEARLVYKDANITILDTPGHVDFSAEMERAILAMDVAILVVSVNEGVQGHTSTVWKLLERYDIPVFVFVNKMDQPGADKNIILNQMKKNIGDYFVNFSPFCEEKDDNYKETSKDKVLEELSLYDEKALDEFLEYGGISDETISDMVMQRKVVPVFFGSALKNSKVISFMDGLVRFTKEKEYPEEFGARVYKISKDEQGNLLTHVKVTGGSLKVKSLLDMGDDKEKINQIRLYSGNSYDVAGEVNAGETCALTGLNKSFVGQCFGNEKEGKSPLLIPILTYRMTASGKVDDQVLMQKLGELSREEPQLGIRWDSELNEITIQLMGEVQTQILKETIKNRFDIDVEFDKGSIIYRETIANTVYGVGHFEPLRHYAEVLLKLEPAPKGSGVVIETDCCEDILAKNWQRLIVTNLHEKEHKGVLVGAPVTDIKITLVKGKAHIKHTEGGDFRQASYRAVRQGLMEAQSVLLEPFLDFELKVPACNVGRAMSDIQMMHGNVNISENDGNIAILNGYAPAACIRDYHLKVVSYTKGQGNLSLTFRDYGPCHNADEIIIAKQYNPESDIENTPDSVFCAHGAGFVVPWNQVKSYMHTTLSDERQMNDIDNNNTQALSRTVKEYTGSYADDKELEKIFIQTFGKKDDSPRRDMFRKKPDCVDTSAKRVPVHLRNRKPKDKYLLVDGYNIIFAWDYLKELSNDNLDAARMKLMDVMCNYQGYTKYNLIVVFDAYRVKGHKCESLRYNNITVVYTAQAQTADSYIEQFSHEMAEKYDITVATSDRLEQIIILGEGASRLSARDFLAEVMRVEQAIREKIE